MGLFPVKATLGIVREVDEMVRRKLTSRDQKLLRPISDF
jgi:hypothetical protein